MSITLSPIARSIDSAAGGHFSVHRLDLRVLQGFIAPIMGFEHFEMSGPTFAPHPHAGFSAVSYVFESSPGSLRNRDSLGHDLVVRPGEMVWTQASRGVIHDEHPDKNGVTVHGLQLFVNLRSEHKHIPPRALHASLEAIPVHRSESGNRTRVLSGEYQGLVGPIQPAEPFDFLDVKLSSPWSRTLKAGQNTLIYVLHGTVRLSVGGDQRLLRQHGAIGARVAGTSTVAVLEPQGEAQVLLLSGKDPEESVAVYGPFIMNTRDEFEQAYERYRSGQMGRLTPQA